MLFEEEIVEEAAPQQASALPEPEGFPLPRANPDLLGHEAVESALLADHQGGRLPHAMIFAGPSGIGKATAAFRFARFLFNEGNPDGAGAGLFGDAAPPTSFYVDPHLPVFRQVVSGGHPDLLTIERAFDEKRGRYKTEIAVDDIRRIAPFLRMTAAMGGWRVVVIDDGDALNRNGQNALLKILEEPPSNALLILVTSRPGGLLPTIRSRCRVVNFQPLPESDVMALLRRALPQENETTLRILSRMSEGSMGRALQLAQEGGVGLYESLLEMLEPLPQVQPLRLHALAERLGQNGAEQSYRTTMQLLLWWLERMARYQARNSLPPEIMSGESTIMAKLAKCYSPENWLDLWEKLSHIFTRSEEASLDRRLTVMGMFEALANAR